MPLDPDALFLVTQGFTSHLVAKPLLSECPLLSRAPEAVRVSALAFAKHATMGQVWNAQISWGVSTNALILVRVAPGSILL